MFNLQSKKGVFCYDYYTEELYLENIGDTEEATKYLKVTDKKEEFI
jgi:hypothetical protein